VGRGGKAGRGLVAVVMAGVVVAACSSSPIRWRRPSRPAGARHRSSPSRERAWPRGRRTSSPSSVGSTSPTPRPPQALADDNTKATAVVAVLTQGGSGGQGRPDLGPLDQPQYNSQRRHHRLRGVEHPDGRRSGTSPRPALIDSVAGAGGNATRLDSLNFSVEDTRSLEDQARNDAVHQAVSHAKSMAEAAGERLGPVCSLSDQTQIDNYEEPFASAAGLPSGDKAAAAVPLDAGSQQERLRSRWSTRWCRPQRSRTGNDRDRHRHREVPLGS
jgi:hypothetical protein